MMTTPAAEAIASPTRVTALTMPRLTPKSTTISNELIELSACIPTPLLRSAISPLATPGTTPITTTGNRAMSGLRKITSSSRTISAIVPTATIASALPDASRWS
jgi:hypothetical protein